MTLEGLEPKQEKMENSEKEPLTEPLISDDESLNLDIAENSKIESVSITPINEYLDLVKDFPSIDHAIESRELEASIKGWELNRRNSLMLKELIQNGLVEEVSYFSNQEKEMSDSAFIENMQNGFKVRSIPVFENGEIIGHKYYRELNNISNEQQQKKQDIESKYVNEASQSWFYREQEKEKILNQKVTSGEMVYLGTVSTDEHITMIKNGLTVRSSEEVVTFNDQRQPTDYIKLYAYVH